MQQFVIYINKLDINLLQLDEIDIRVAILVDVLQQAGKIDNLQQIVAFLAVYSDGFNGDLTRHTWALFQGAIPHIQRTTQQFTPHATMFGFGIGARSCSLLYTSTT